MQPVPERFDLGIFALVTNPDWRNFADDYFYDWDAIPLFQVYTEHGQIFGCFINDIPDTRSSSFYRTTITTWIVYNKGLNQNPIPTL